VRLLLDTHAFVWWTMNDPRLSATNRQTIATADVVAVSVVAAWEIAIKVGIGKWPEARFVIEDFEGIVSRDGIDLIPISISDVRRAGFMVSTHRDPFDRLLAAQAMNADLTLITADTKLQQLGADWLW
jgi:PIN domain nuclease of toxin-antitoxin system